MLGANRYNICQVYLSRMERSLLMIFRLCGFLMDYAKYGSRSEVFWDLFVLEEEETIERLE